MITSAIRWSGDIDGFLEIIDQRALPEKLVRLQCKDIETVYDSIRTLTVRGAPAIGVAAAYGLVLALQKCPEQTAHKALSCLKQKCKYLASARPTAVNLFNALDRLRQKGEQFIASNPTAGIRQFKEIIFREAEAIHREDIEMCRRIGENGERFIKDGAGILTHCNAGALATAGEGTALSIFYQAHKKGKRFTVYVDETRPLLQGARLTAWELKEAGLETVVICDNMAGWLMKEGKIDAVIVGADRIAANGDAANKIGTYSLSILAKEHNIPFYIAAPSSTFDLSIPDGNRIPIEQRSADEVAFINGRQVTPKGVGIYNPAFDITEAGNITALITDKAVIERPDVEKIAVLFSRP
jgi:methylthioribose-1-phosphate isomerase